MHAAHVINQAYALYGTALRLQLSLGEGSLGPVELQGRARVHKEAHRLSAPLLPLPSSTPQRPLAGTVLLTRWPPPPPPRAPAAQATDGLAGNCRFVVVHIQGFDVLIDTFNPRAHHAKRTHLPSYFRNIIEIFRSRPNYFNYFSLVFETHTQESQIRK